MRIALFISIAALQFTVGVAARPHMTDDEVQSKSESRPPVSPPQDESPPDLLIVSHGRVAGDESVQFENFIQPLQECGYPYQTLDDVPNSALASKLSEKNLKPAPIVLINGHGVTAKSKPDPGRAGSKRGTPLHPDDPGFEIGSMQTQKWQRGDEMVEIIRDHTKNPKVWVGTCYSGACSVENVCLGTECSKDQTAPPFLFGWRAISRLLCDSYKGDCELWESLDADGTGHINSKTLENFLKTAEIFKTNPVVLNARGLSPSAINEKIDEQKKLHRRTCEKTGGKYGLLATHYIWKYTNKEGFNIEYDLPEFHGISDSATATAKIRDLQKNEKEFGSVDLVRIKLRFFCTEKPKDGQFRSNSEAYFPEVRSFALDSARCRRIIRERRGKK